MRAAGVSWVVPIGWLAGKPPPPAPIVPVLRVVRVVPRVRVVPEVPILCVCSRRSDTVAILRVGTIASVVPQFRVVRVLSVETVAADCAGERDSDG